jgi:tagatose 6-phosphate kinase
MITTVTLNASLDKLYKIKSLAPYEVMRVREMSVTAGGKGLNVAKVAALLGAKVTAMGFAGGHSGALLKELLVPSGVCECFTYVKGETRSCINIWDETEGKSTEFLEPGPIVSAEEQEAFVYDFKKALAKTKFIAISGSMPAGVPLDFYARLITIAKDAGVNVLLDTSGEALKNALNAKPFFVKPNIDEIAQFTGKALTTENEIINAAKQLVKSGIKFAAVSRGEKGVVLACNEGVYKSVSPQIKVVNTVGCGDSMVAGFAVSFEQGLSIQESIRKAVAASAANALCEKTGHISYSDFKNLYKDTIVERIM